MTNYKIISFSCLLALLSACEKTEKVDNFPKHTSKLVTNCFFRPDSAFVFKLTKSLSPIDNAPFKALNSNSAYIRIFENGSLFDSFRVNNSPYPSFNGTKYPKANNTYRFECYYPGFGIVTGEDFLPDTVVVKNASGFYTIRSSYESNDSILTCDFSTSINLDLDFLKTNNKYLIINIQPVFINFKGITVSPANYGYGNYIFDMADMNTANESDFTLFDLFVSNPNGVKKLILQWNNVFAHLKKKGSSYKYFITVTSCSFAAFEYLKRKSLQIENQDDPFSQPTPISNNIINGYGIFGGVNVQKFTISF